MQSTTLSYAQDDRDLAAPASDRLRSTPAGTAMSRKRIWTGRVLTGLSGTFLLLDALVKVFMLAPAVQGTAELGYPADTVFPIGIVLLFSTVLYLVPRTAFYGALLLTGYLGGAVATHVRVGNPLFSHTLFPIYLALLVWAGLALRNRPLDAVVRMERARR